MMVANSLVNNTSDVKWQVLIIRQIRYFVDQTENKDFENFAQNIEQDNETEGVRIYFRFIKFRN